MGFDNHVGIRTADNEDFHRIHKLVLFGKANLNKPELAFTPIFYIFYIFKNNLAKNFNLYTTEF